MYPKPKEKEDRDFIRPVNCGWSNLFGDAVGGAENTEHALTSNFGISRSISELVDLK